MPLEFMKSNPRPDSMNENNDCAVRATTIASELPYEQVHQLYSQAGRKPRKGTFVATIRSVINKLNDKHTFISYTGYKCPTLSRFIKDNPKGKWVICRRGHAFAVKDGVVYDAHKSQAGARCRVLFAIKVKD